MMTIEKPSEAYHSWHYLRLEGAGMGAGPPGLAGTPCVPLSRHMPSSVSIKETCSEIITNMMFKVNSTVTQKYNYITMSV